MGEIQRTCRGMRRASFPRRRREASSGSRNSCSGHEKGRSWPPLSRRPRRMTRRRRRLLGRRRRWILRQDEQPPIEETLWPWVEGPAIIFRCRGVHQEMRRYSTSSIPLPRSYFVVPNWNSRKALGVFAKYNCTASTVGYRCCKNCGLEQSES